MADYLNPGTPGRTRRAMRWQPSIGSDLYVEVPAGTPVVTTDYPRDVLGHEMYPVEIPGVEAFAGAERMITRGDITLDAPELADQLAPVLEAAGPDGLTPSAAGRAAGLTTGQAHQALTWMVANQFAGTTGNGARTHYHPR